MWQYVANPDYDVSVIQFMSCDQLHHQVIQHFLLRDIDVLSHDKCVL